MNPFAAVFDVETSELHAVGLGQLICAVILPLGGKPIVLRTDTMKCTVGHEKKLVKKLVEELSKYHLLIGVNSDDFDWGFVKSRAIHFGIAVPQPFPLSYDLKKAFKRSKLRTVDNGYGKPSCSLAMMVDFYGLRQQKTGLFPNHHAQTLIGEGSEKDLAMEDLVDHCVKDVRMTEELFNRLIKDDPSPLIRRFK